MQRPLDPNSLRPQAQRTPLVSFHCIMRRTSKWPAVFICVLLVTNCVGSGWLEDARLEVQAEAAVSLARRYQCPGAAVSMPCPPRGNRIHHLHIGKTGGRSVIAELPLRLGSLYAIGLSGLIGARSSIRMFLDLIRSPPYVGLQTKHASRAI